MTPSKQAAGTLMAIGGAEDKVHDCTILTRFVELASGRAAQIAVVPTASEVPDKVSIEYQALLQAQKLASVTIVRAVTRAQANAPETVAALDHTTGIFLTGGDQVKLMATLGGTRLADQIHSRWIGGATVAGTSAGASALSRHMIAFGSSGALPSPRKVQLAPGLGLLPEIIIDQHFRQRDRLGRLLTAVAYNPRLLGIGLDEDTALIVDGNGMCEVLGSGAVTVIDGNDLIDTDIHAAQEQDPVALLGMTLHVLKSGYSFDLSTRTPSAPGSPDVNL